VQERALLRGLPRALGRGVGETAHLHRQSLSRDLYLWDTFPDHNDLVRGYILEKYFTETDPDSKLSRLRSFGGLSGVEYETPASPVGLRTNQHRELG